MNNETIILISAIMATATLIGIKVIIYIIKSIQINTMTKNSQKRMKELEELENQGKIKTTIIDLQNEKFRVKNPDYFNGLIVDGKKYNDLTSWFIKKKEGLYIIGKQEDYIIKLLINKN